MSSLLRSPRMIVAVLAAYAAAHVFGAVLHEHLHTHAPSDVCCHGHDHPHDVTTVAKQSTADPAVRAIADQHDCSYCQMLAQPVVTAQFVDRLIAADVCPDSLPTLTRAPHTLALRFSQSRAPPIAA